MKLSNAWTLASMLSILFAGCDLATTSTTPVKPEIENEAARTATPVEKPFGDKFIWNYDLESGYWTPGFKLADLIYQQQREKFSTPSVATDKLIEILDRDTLSHVYPGVHLYGIPDVIPEYKDCNIDHNQATNKCGINAAIAVYSRQAKILDSYAIWANRFSKDLAKRKYNTHPLVWLLEGDVMQFARDSATAKKYGTFSYKELGAFLNQIRGVINKNCPNSITGYTLSTWLAPHDIMDFVQGINSKNNQYGSPFSFIWIASGLTRSKLDNVERNAGALYMDYRWIHKNAKLPILSGGNVTADVTNKNMLDRSLEGVVSARIGAKPGNTEQSVIKYAKTVATGKTPADLQPELYIDSVRRFKTINSVKVYVRAYDYTHTYGKVAIPSLRLLINGKYYQSIENKNAVESKFVFIIRNVSKMKANESTKLNISITASDNQTVNKNAILTANKQLDYAQSVKILENGGTFSIQSFDKALQRYTITYQVVDSKGKVYLSKDAHYPYSTAKYSKKEVAGIIRKSGYSLQIWYNDPILAASKDFSKGWSLQSQIPINF